MRSYSIEVLGSSLEYAIGAELGADDIGFGVDAVEDAIVGFG